MLKPAILALIRQILTVAGTALVAKGLVQASDVEPVIGALLTIGSTRLIRGNRWDWLRASESAVDSSC